MKTLQSTIISSNVDIIYPLSRYIIHQDIFSRIVGMIYTILTKASNCVKCSKLIDFISIRISKCISPSPRPKGAQKLSNLHSSPNSWHDISNTNKGVQLCEMSQTVWFHINTYIKMYIINCSIFLTAVLLSPYSVHYQTLCAKRTIKTLQFTIIPQVLAVYIHYQYIYSNLHSSPNSWHDISNTNIYSPQTKTP